MSGWLTGVADMRAAADGSMADTCEVVRDTLVTDSSGGSTTTPATVATCPCGRHAVGSGPERAMADRLGWTVAEAIRLPLTVDVTPSDRIVSDGRTFEVGAILENGAYATAKIAVCQELNP